MDYIYDLVSQMGKRAILIDRKPLMGKRAYKLYQYLKKTTNPSPAGEAAVLDCTVGGAVHRRTLYHLEVVLVNNLMTLRPGEMTSGKLEDTRKYIWKLIAIGRRQVFKSNSVVVVPFLKEAFHLAEDARLVFPAKIASESLSIMLAHLHFNEKEYHFYRKKADYYREVNLILQKSIICFRKLTYLNSIGEDTSLLVSMAEAGLESLESRNEETENLTLSLMEFQLKIKISEIKNEPLGVIEHASNALMFLEANTENTHDEELAFTTYLGYSYLLTNNYEKGVELIDRLLYESDRDSHNFGKMSEIKVLLSLRTGRYQEAFKAYIAFSDNLHWSKKASYFDKSKTLFQAYLYLLMNVNVISYELNEAEMHLKKMGTGVERLSLSTDVIDSIHYHIINFILQVVRQNHRRARDHWRALPTPKKGVGMRYKYFYTLLSIVFEQDFHRMAVERHAAKFLKKLRSKPFEGELAVSLEEVVPFEELWSLTLNQLDNKRVKLR